MKDQDEAVSALLIRLAAALGFWGVALGAFGAHALAPRLEAAGRADTWETAVFYHLVHAVALLGLAGCERLRARRWIGLLWAGGVAVFSGTLYLLALTGITWLGAITPLGGVALLAGWTWLAFARPSTRTV